MIIELSHWNLSTDAWVDIFSFLTPSDLLCVSLTCKQFARFILDTNQESCSHVWYNLCINQTKTLNENEPISDKLLDPNQGIYTYKELYRARDFVFDKDIMNMSASRVEFSNGNHTAFNSRQSSLDKWELLRVNHPMKSGCTCHYEFVVDQLREKSRENSWMICVGLTSSDTMFQKEKSDSFPPWLGYTARAIGLILFEGTWLGERKLTSGEYTEKFAQQKVPFTKDGDVIGFVVNRLHPLKILVDVYINGEKLLKSTYEETINNDSTVFYPAASIVNQRKVSVYGGLHRTKKLAPEPLYFAQ